jgi:hypothetical protein
MGHASVLLHCAFVAVHGFLWIKIMGYTWIHKDKKVLSTWMNVEGVIKIGYLTLKQKLKNKLWSIQGFTLLPELWKF